MDARRPRIRLIVTPEGTVLPFEVAAAADRAAALFVDLVLIHLCVLILFAPAVLLGAAGFGAHLFSIALLGSFLVRNFYYAYFEIRWGGATPGKRKFGLRVISREGGPLSAEGVLTRNLTREFEVFLPLTTLAAPEALLPGLPAWAALLGSTWLMLGALLPLFNADRLRLGDLLGGTLVVSVPRTALLADLADSSESQPMFPRVAEAHGFTDEQLDLYGIQQLQVLEDLLRRGRGGNEPEVLKAVAQRIKDKIGWPVEDRPGDAREFLRAFYERLRAHLERKVLFGVRQENKKPGKLSRAQRAPTSRRQPVESGSAQVAHHAEGEGQGDPRDHGKASGASTEERPPGTTPNSHEQRNRANEE